MLPPDPTAPRRQRSSLNLAGLGRRFAALDLPPRDDTPVGVGGGGSVAGVGAGGVGTAGSVSGIASLGCDAASPASMGAATAQPIHTQTSRTDAARRVSELDTLPAAPWMVDQ